MSKYNLNKFSATSVSTTLAVVSYGQELWAKQEAKALRLAAGGDANDNPTGTGAAGVLVTGPTYPLGVEETVLIPTNGAAASAYTTELFYRVNTARAVVNTATSAYIEEVEAGNNQSDLVCQDSDGDTAFTIPRTAGRTLIGHYFVPAGVRLTLERLQLMVNRTSGQDRNIVAKLVYRENAIVNGSLVSEHGVTELQPYAWETTSQLPPDVMRRELPSLSELWVVAGQASGSGSTTVALKLFGKLHRSPQPSAGPLS